MTQAEQLAKFVVRASYGDLSEAARSQLKIRILDALGCAIGALDGRPISFIKAQIEDFDGKGATGHCTLIGGGKSAPDRAALYNSALVRYLDFNDSYLAKGETCHPSDNLGAVLSAAEYANISGRELLTALAVAYQVQCRLSDVAPVRAKGFDHTTQGSYAVAAGVSKSLGLDETTDRQRDCDLWDGFQCTAGYPNWGTLPLEGAGLSKHSFRLHPRNLYGDVGHYGSDGGL